MDKTIRDYNLISNDFSRTRLFPSEDVQNLRKYVKSKEKVLDLGCGNGRFFEVLKDKEIDFFGVDTSERLIKIAKTRYPEAKFQIANAFNLPFPSDYFDKIFSIAVLHHIPSREFRLQFLRETRRVLKPEGILILRIWNLWKRKGSLRLLLKYVILKLIGKSKLDFKDVFIPWKDSRGKIIVNRYFHSFTKKELEGLVKKAGFRIRETWYEGKTPQANIYLVAEKSP